MAECIRMYKTISLYWACSGQLPSERFCLLRFSHWHVVRWSAGLLSVATIEKLCHEPELTGTAVQHIFGSRSRSSTSPCRLSHPNPLPSPLLPSPLCRACPNCTLPSGSLLEHTHTQSCGSAPPVWIRHITAVPDSSFKTKMSLSPPMNHTESTVIPVLWI